jgi:membrane protease YdiL (CAAX protease family)
MVVPFLASLVYFVGLPGSITATVVYAATKVFTVIWPVVAVLMIEGVRIQRGARDWRKHLSAIPVGVMTGLFIGGLILGACAWTPLGEYVRRFAGPIAAKVAEIGIAEPLRYVAFSAFLAGLHSLIEEFYWRWYVFGRLMMVAPQGIAFLLAGLSFAAHHYVLLGGYFSATGAFAFGTAVGVGGAFWCWMYRRQRTLAGVWVSHAIVDLAICYVGYRVVFG